MSDKKKRIAILGGGMSSLVTAFELSTLPDWKKRYASITVYQQGWRLGGKGASGRNRARGDRIEEHGLHLLFGCYENAFRILRQCYAELPRTWPWKFEDAFKGDPEATTITMFERDGDTWLPWTVRVPTRDGEPGVGPPLPWGGLNALDLLISWARSEARAWQEEIAWISPSKDIGLPSNVPLEILDAAEDALGKVFGSLVADAVDAAESVRETVEEIKGLLAGAWSAARGAFEDLLYVVAGIESAPGLSQERVAPGRHRVSEELLDSFLERIDDFLRWNRDQPGVIDHIRRARIVIDFALTVSKGLVRDRAVLPADNWFVIDNYDLREWLERHGAMRETRESALVQGLYDAIFSWNAPVGAGTILHALIRASHYKGSLIYRMQAGMGDTIFAPLYEVLRRRGVKFEFFHRVENLVLSADRTRVEKVVVDRQVRLKKAAYKPLIEVGGLPCWPSEPIWSQIDDRQAAALAGHDLENWWDQWRGSTRVLEAGRDFDILVLGIGIGAFSDICRELIDNRQQPAFGRMVASLATTQTQALQLWMNKSIDEIGWPEKSIVIPYTDPLDTWADMSHLLPRENLPSTVKNIAYLCSSMDDDQVPPPPRTGPSYPDWQRQRVLAYARQWLERSAATLWPGAADAGGGFDWNILHTWSGHSGQGCLAEQHYCATVNPSDRYVRVVPGSNAARLRADQSGYANLYLTGDWTMTAMSIGCLEGATMAGIQTARAIDPAVPKAVYDWLPDEPPGTPRPRAPGSRAVAAVWRRPYVMRKEDLLVVPPVGLIVDVKIFVLRAGEAALARLCDNNLNLGPGASYRPAGPFVVLYCADMDHVVPEGRIGGQEIGIWVPVIADDSGGNARQLMTYSPLLWVNSSPALIGGRAVYGFPKHMAILTMPRQPGDAAVFAVDTPVMPIQGGVAEQCRLLCVRRTDRDTWEDGGASWDPEQLLATLELVLKTGSNIGAPTIDLVRQLFEPAAGMPMVFLKQFPHVDGTWDACYQAVVEAPVEITGGRRGGPIPGSYEVDFLRCWSHEIVPRFDLEVQRSYRDNDRTYDVVRAVASGWMAFRSQVKPGRVVWEG